MHFLDIYRGKCAKNREEAGHLIGGLDWQGAVADIIGNVKYLKSTGCTKVGVLGFCIIMHLFLFIMKLLK